jgi:hypothetical protein
VVHKRDLRSFFVPSTELLLIIHSIIGRRVLAENCLAIGIMLALKIGRGVVVQTAVQLLCGTQ